jgi:hypothetical protein
MNDLFFFLKQGWKNIWNMRAVWLFSALPVFNPFIRVLLSRQQTEPLLILGSLLGNFLTLIFLITGAIGVPYIAYCFSTGEPATSRDALSAVGEFGVRIILSGCLGILVIAPCLLLALGLSLDTSAQPPELLNRFFILALPVSLLNAMFYFPLFEFFAKDARIQQSIRESWNLFTLHFRVLAVLGILSTGVYRVIYAAAGFLTVLLQSGFDVPALRTLNFVNPSASLRGNLLFLFINGAMQMILTVWTASIFALAYLKYRKK